MDCGWSTCTPDALYRALVPDAGTLFSVAAPQFREARIREAEKMGIWRKQNR